MKKYLIWFSLICGTFVFGACSVFGDKGVEIARYTILQTQENFEVRKYERLVLVSTPMQGQGGRGNPFSKLFNYISGKNEKSMKIEMTAPVFMDQNGGDQDVMSFVMPSDMDLKDVPLPSDPLVRIEVLEDYTAASIRFSGRLSRNNILKHKSQLEEWVAKNKFKVLGAAKTAGYNAPFTPPFMRRNEVLIPIAENSVELN